MELHVGASSLSDDVTPCVLCTANTSCIAKERKGNDTRLVKKCEEGPIQHRIATHMVGNDSQVDGDHERK
jgi:hypothetical protein